jgi:hypothetical protein
LRTMMDPQTDHAIVNSCRMSKTHAQRRTGPSTLTHKRILKCRPGSGHCHAPCFRALLVHKHVETRVAAAEGIFHKSHQALHLLASVAEEHVVLATRCITQRPAQPAVDACAADTCKQHQYNLLFQRHVHAFCHLHKVCS